MDFGLTSTAAVRGSDSRRIRSRPPVFWRTADAYRNEHFQPTLKKPSSFLSPISLSQPANDTVAPQNHAETSFLTSLWAQESGNAKLRYQRAINAYQTALNLETNQTVYLDMAA